MSRDSVEEAYLAIRAGILDGSYASGQHLTGETLAKAAGVSRTPVREALRRLHAEGLVCMVPNQGATVVGWTDTDVDQIFGLRVVLECYAVEQATPRLSARDIDRISLLADRTHALAEARPDGFRDLIAEANSVLHKTIVDGAENPRLARMIAGLTEMPLIMRTLRIYSPDDLLRSAGHHRELAAAFGARDPMWASAVMRSHLLAARRATMGNTAPPDLEQAWIQQNRDSTE